MTNKLKEPVIWRKAGGINIYYIYVHIYINDIVYMHIYIYFYTATHFVLMNHLQSAVYQTTINQWIWKINEINSSIKWFWSLSPG